MPRSRVAGATTPPIRTIAEYHPQFALALLMGATARVDLRPMSVDFDSAAFVGQVKPAQFSEPIGRYSIFLGASATIDPTSAFEGNPLKYVNDVLMADCTGITVTVQALSNSGVNFNPVSEETPLQDVPGLLSLSAVAWALRMPDQMKATFTLTTIPNGTPNGLPFTAWLTFAFLTLGSDCPQVWAMTVGDARQQLKDQYGITL